MFLSNVFNVRITNILDIGWLIGQNFGLNDLAFNILKVNFQENKHTDSLRLLDIMR